MMPDFKLIFTVSTDPRSDLGVDGEPAPPDESAYHGASLSEGGRTSPSSAFVKAFRVEMEAADVAYEEELRREARLWFALMPQASPGRTDAPSPGEDPHDPPPCGDEPATPDALSPPSRGASGSPVTRYRYIESLDEISDVRVSLVDVVRAFDGGTLSWHPNVRGGNRVPIEHAPRFVARHFGIVLPSTDEFKG